MHDANKGMTERVEDELDLAGFDEMESPEADAVSLGEASYTKMLGKIFRAGDVGRLIGI